MGWVYFKKSKAGARIGRPFGFLESSWDIDSSSTDGLTIMFSNSRDPLYSTQTKRSCKQTLEKLFLNSQFPQKTIAVQPVRASGSDYSPVNTQTWVYNITT